MKKSQSLIEQINEFVLKENFQLPVFNELYVVERLIRAVAALEYPRELLEIQVLDDSTDETSNIAKHLSYQLRVCGHTITYLQRGQRTGWVPGSAPVPRQTGQLSRRGISTSFSQPNTASSKVSERE